MGKNIILCSDGTGNKGGYGADTNVFKLYNAVDIHDAKTQITFYDDGVGTSTNKYIRAVTGAFGLGFGRNIRDLYAFLARNYDPGDDIYLFGFSRGAATVRAFAGMVQECGLLNVNSKACQSVRKVNGKDKKFFDERKFQDLIKEAFKAYQRTRYSYTHAQKFKGKFGVEINDNGLNEATDVPIKFIGVWDTVSALGFPRDWSWAVNWIFEFLEIVVDFFFPYTFYNYQLNKNVESVHHAIAIDDERKTFHPKVWKEKPNGGSFKFRKFFKPRRDFEKPVHIEQVWFAGVHSNVGGGYPRAGLSLVTLHWMMLRARSYGLRFKGASEEPEKIEGTEKEVRNAANVYGRLYDSRDGFAIYYRFKPRVIDELCKGRLKGPVKIHKTVIDRMRARTLGYAPEYIPEIFEIVDTPLDSESKEITWNCKNRAEINAWVAARKTFYRIFVEATLVLIALSVWFWKFPPAQEFPGKPVAFLDLFSSDKWSGITEWFYLLLAWAARHLTDILLYVLPEFIEPFVVYAFLVKPEVSLGIILAGFWFYFIREYFRDKTQLASETARESLLVQMPDKPGGDD